MQPEVIYLGYRVNKDGIFPLPEKIDFIKNNFRKMFPN